MPNLILNVVPVLKIALSSYYWRNLIIKNEKSIGQSLMHIKYETNQNQKRIYFVTYN